MAVDVATDLAMFIDGTAAESVSGEWLEVRSPASGQLVGRVPAGTSADVDRGIDSWEPHLGWLLGDSPANL
jgi:acyl-CoA reductase-like NAD-dependent aldehyde dehydrogenase